MRVSSSFFLWSLFPYLLSTSGGSGIFRSDNEPFPPLHVLPDAGASDNVIRNFISATLADNMVLQRDKPAMVWGYSKSGGVKIQATLSRQSNDKGKEDEDSVFEPIATLETTADDDGLWRIQYPAQSASLTPHRIDVTAPTTGEKGSLDNVLFGDVYLCGGQSNMEWSMPGQTNGTEEVQEATDHYSHIRVVTIGCYNRSTTPLPDLQTIEYQWSLPSYDSMHKGGFFGRFSSVCWYFGKEIANFFDNKVPIGLINNNWGGSAIESWQVNGDMYNAMIYPYMIGPMALSGFTWYQAEANTKDQASADKYADDFPTMIQSWRKGFNAPDAYFGFLILSTWCPINPVAVAQMRQAQMKAFEFLPKIGYATNADHGAGCNIHPPDKRPCSHRLAQSALALQYGQSIPWKSPTYAKATTAVTNTDPNSMESTPSVVIEFHDVSDRGLYVLDNPYNNQLDPADFNCTGHPEGTCAWSQVLLNGQDGWVDAKLEIQDGNKVVMTPTSNTNSATAGVGVGEATIVATSYAWGAVPMMTLYDAGTDLPVLGWNEKI